MELVVAPAAVNANSYCTLEEADAYHSTRGHNDEWAAADPEAKKLHLVWATRLLDQENWNGVKNTFSQMLRWPRGSVRDRDGYLLPNTTIPNFLKEAQAELAFHLIRDDRTEDQGALRARAEQMGSMHSSGVTRVCMPDAVTDMIAPYVAPRMRIRRT